MAMIVGLRCLREAKPGGRWRQVFDRTWPHYREWYLSQGGSNRPSYLACRHAIDSHMPELSSIYRTLCDLSGGGDIESRYLSLWGPPPFMSGCTQLIWPGDPPAVVRNYDYNPKWFEGTMFYTDWCRPVIAITDCNWGVLDGMNADGLCASLAFGGRRSTGAGFGIPLVLRYVLETCTSVTEARAALTRVPVHMAYNVVLLDRQGDHVTAFVGPDREPGFHDARVSSNHQEHIDWPEYAAATATVERETTARELLATPVPDLGGVVKRFLAHPLYRHSFATSFGTLYTAAWIPARGEVQIAWPHARLLQTFARFEEQRRVVTLRNPAGTQLTR